MPIGEGSLKPHTHTPTGTDEIGKVIKYAQSDVDVRVLVPHTEGSHSGGINMSSWI
jgi:hypothetical protein